MPVLYTNNAASALSASITNTATSFSVTAGHGARFPAISGGDHFYATLIDTAGNIEIVRVTALSTDTFTVTRGQDGTTGRAFSAGDRVELRLTRLMLDDIKTDTRSALTSLNVTTALGFTPYNATNPSGYISQDGNARVGVENNGTLVGTRRRINFIPGTGISLSISDDSGNEEVDVTITSTVTAPVSSVFGRTGAVTLTSGDVTGALGFTPVSTAQVNRGGSGGADVNTLTTSGFYRINNTEANRPGDWGQLLTVHGGSDTIGQLYFDYTNGAILSRAGNPTNVGGSGSWSAWRTNLNSANVGSFALPIGGGSLTTGASSNLFIGRNSTATGYNAISLNGNSADSSNMGLTGGGSGDTTLYINSPGSISIRTNSFGNTFSFSGSNFSAPGTINTPAGYVSNSNPWGTSNSAFFPNGITTAGGTNWVYGNTFIGNAPGNGSGLEVSSNGRLFSSVSSGTAMHVRRTGSGATATNSYTALFEQTHGDHSWGIVAEFRVGNSNGSDRPSILFSNGYNTTTWSVGFGSSDDQFRINQNHGHRNGGWGTERFRIDTSGNSFFGGSVYVSGNNFIDFGPNSSWGATLRVGGNGHSGGGRASVVTTNGNLHLDGSNNNGVYLNWYNSGTSGTYFGNGAGGQVGRIDGGGTATFSGNVTANSDERLKTDWAALPVDYIERLATVKSGTYTRIDSGERQAGASAQDMRNLLTEVVLTAPDKQGTLSLAYGNAALVSAIELAKRLLAAEKEIAVLKELTRGPG